MCDGEFEGSVRIESSWRKARKTHRCFACRREIRVGDRYHREFQEYEGEADFYKHCARCWAIVEALFENGAESVQWDLACGTDWVAAFGDDPPENVARLAFVTLDEAQELTP